MGTPACTDPTALGLRPVAVRALAAMLGALLVACGGGGGGAAPAAPAPPALPPSDGGLDDPTVYSSAPDASLPGFVEASVITEHSLQLDGQRLAYRATAGHLIARELGGAERAQAAVFYVAYTRPGLDAATRPVTFFYNGGPGSASVWLQLGSFGPRRLVSGVPATSAPRPFPLVDNADSLLGVSDLVFVNAVGSGRSQAIAPFTNRSFWGVGADAALFRDAVRRYLAANGRSNSPLFLYGESYGGPRSAVLARRLLEAGVRVDGVVLQSPAMDYHSNCGVGNAAASCAPYFPSYAATAAWHQGMDAGAFEPWVADNQRFTDQQWAPVLGEFLLGRALPPAPLLAELGQRSGVPAATWQVTPNLGPTRYRELLRPGELLGRYDARMRAPLGSALASEGDPSQTWLTDSFVQGIAQHLGQELKYRNASTYVLFSNAIQFWDFRHEGRSLPDTIPDLAVALNLNPQLRVLAVSGVQDLATPFHLTALDLARLANPRVRALHYQGGHMSFLDDQTRPRQRADLQAFYAEALANRTAQAVSAPQRQRADISTAEPDRAGTPQLPGFRRPTPLEPALHGLPCDPCVPPR